jgi:1,5-anhydro-D-fructose reductase (1,5-anhydro-D-mannitol-forming)
MQRVVRWGIVGCGDVTEKKSGPAFKKANGSALVAVMRRTAALARDYALRHGVPRWYDDADALIADPQVDAVYVATPPSSHAEIAIRCAAARKPAYVEKPMAASTAECEAMIEAFCKAGVPLFVAYYRRALPRYLAVKHGIAAGRIGAPRHVQIRLCKKPWGPLPSGQPVPWRYVPSISAGGRFVDLASHTLDMLDDLLGPVTHVRAFAVNQATPWPVEDAVAAAFVFASGVVGTGSWCFTASATEDDVTVIGTDGSVSFPTFGTHISWIRNGMVERVEVPNPEHIQQPLIQTVVDDLLDRGRCPSTGQSAMRTTAIIDAVLAEHRASIASR